MNTQKIAELLSDLEPKKVEKYIEYCRTIRVDKNPWIVQRSPEQLASFYRSVIEDGLEFDGKHITLISTGISYDYVAYKNKMFLAYPETLIDVQLVHKDDKFQFTKESGKVTYKHEIVNPFGTNDSELVGCYCVVKNKRGEFINTLTMEEIQKHRKVAKTDFIWKSWFSEMVLKTVIKKACKTHFADVFQNMETLDNMQNDVSKPLGISIETKQEIEAFTDVDELREYYSKNKKKNAGVKEDFAKACTERKDSIFEELKKEVEDGDN